MNWKSKKLGEILTIERGGSPRPIQKYLTESPDGINWIKISDATASDKYIFNTKEKISKDGLHKTRIVNEGDFILSNSMSFGRPYIMKTTGCIHDGWLVLKQNGERIFETEFLYYLLSSPFVFNQFDSLAAGSTVRNLNIALVSSVEVPVPPLPEQQRIVSILDECFSVIERSRNNAEKNLQNAKELFDSCLQNVFQNDQWEKKELGKVCLKTNNIKWSNSNGNSYHYIDLTAVCRDELKILETNQINVENAPSRAKKIVKQGDIIFATTRPTLKRLTAIPEKYNNQICSTGFTVLRPNPEKVISNFIFYSLLQESFMNRMEALQRGASYPAVTDSDVKGFLIPLPTIEEQKAIVDELDITKSETKKLETLYQKKIVALDELKKSILQKAFQGELETEKELAL